MRSNYLFVDLFRNNKESIFFSFIYYPDKILSKGESLNIFLSSLKLDDFKNS